MAQTETKKVAERDFTARKFTVGDVIDILTESVEKKPDVIDMLFPESLGSVALYKSLGITIDDIGDLLPEQVEELMAMVSKINPSFAGMVKLLKSIALAQLNNSSGLVSA